MMETLARLSETWLRWALDASWQLALLVALIALVAALTRRLSAQFRYALWLLVLVKVFLPPSLGLPWSVGQWASPHLFRHLPGDITLAVEGTNASEDLAQDGSVRVPTERSLESSSKARASASPAEFAPLEPEFSEPAVVASFPQGAHSGASWRAWLPETLVSLLPVVWLIGVMGFLSLVTIRYAWLRRALRRAEEIDEGPLRVLLERLAQRIGTSGAPDLLLSDRVTSPFLFGLFRPRIVLPSSLSSTLRPGELESVLFHELVHWKRWDVLVGWAQVLGQALFWFHPLVWFANSRLRHEREAACDEATLALGRGKPEEYGESILKVLLAARGRSTVAAGYLGIFERNSKLQRRLEDIMKRKQRRRRLSGWGWAFILLFAVATLPMAGARERKTPLRSVLFVLGADEMSLEGETTSLDKIRSRLEKIEDRENTILCFAVDTQDLTIAEVAPVKGKLLRLTEELGFKYFSNTGVHPLGAYAVGESSYHDRILKEVTLDVERGPDGDRLTVQHAVMAICKAADIPYEFEKSARLADPMRRRYIHPLHLMDVMAERALLHVLNPVGLRFDLDEKGLFLKFHGEFQPKGDEAEAAAKEAPSESVSETGKEPEASVAKADSSIALQKMIDACPRGAVLKVPPGRHDGPLEIEKPLTLVGESAEKCIVELLGNEPTILVRGTEKVTIQNLTVRWSPKSTDQRMEYPAAIAVRDGKVTIRGCRLEPVERPEQTPYALLAVGRSEVTFTEGYSTGFAYALMFIEGASGTVSDSFLEKAGHSVVTLHEYSRVKIEGNILARCGYHAVRNTGGKMEMASNLVADNRRAGAYLGNKPAHGTISNNLFTGSNGEIWGYSSSDVTIRNNLFWKSRGAAIGCRDTCRLKLVRNSFVSNPVGIAVYDYAKQPGEIGATSEANHFWQNDEDTKNFDKNLKSVSGDPGFVDPEHGDFRMAGGKASVGLLDPEPIRKLWERYAETR